MSQLMDYYKAIEDSSAGMLDAARREDWGAVLGRVLGGGVRVVAGRPVADAALKATGGWHPDSGARRAANHIVRPACSWCRCRPAPSGCAHSRRPESRSGLSGWRPWFLPD